MQQRRKNSKRLLKKSGDNWHNEYRQIGKCRICGEISIFINKKTDFYCGWCIDGDGDLKKED